MFLHRNNGDVESQEDPFVWWWWWLQGWWGIVEAESHIYQSWWTRCQSSNSKSYNPTLTALWLCIVILFALVMKIKMHLKKHLALMKTLKVSVSRNGLFCSLFYRMVMVQLVVACLFEEKEISFFILSDFRLLQAEHNYLKHYYNSV